MLFVRVFSRPLQVIPQLIARIDHPRRLVAKRIHDLLTDMGKQHSQVCVYAGETPPCPPPYLTRGHLPLCCCAEDICQLLAAVLEHVCCKAMCRRVYLRGFTFCGWECFFLTLHPKVVRFKYM